MTESVVLPTVAESITPARVNLPPIASWVVRRLTLADRLDVGVSGLLTVVTGPTGSGKTTGVAAWAADADLSGGVVWLSLGRGGADPGSFWRHLRGGLVEAGAGTLPQIPSVGCTEARRIGMLADFGAALRGAGPWVVVLDDYPSGSPGRLERELEIVLDHARRAVRLVVISQDDPAIDLHRHSVAGELTRVVDRDLALDYREVVEVLRRHDVDATEATVKLVERHTAGWACGVRHAALALRDAPSTEAAMQDTDRAIADYLAREVLATLPEAVRELIVRTSVVDEVSPGLAAAILGPGTQATPRLSGVRNAFIDLRDDGSFRCHPLLRVTALSQLAQERPGLSQQARRRAARWYIDHGEASGALRLAMAAGDWPWVARVLVESHEVPRILAGTAGDVVDSAVRVPSVGAAEPVLAAALALAHRNADAAAGPLAQAAALGADGARDSLADRLGIGFARLATARISGDARNGMSVASRSRELLAQLPVVLQEELPELSMMLDAYVGAFEACAGDLHRAARTLTRGVGGPNGSMTCRVARVDCAGQLALVEAVQGDLRGAMRHASLVLTGDADPAQAGAVHAHLARTWVHLERGELGRSRQSLDRAADPRSGGLEPWLLAVQQLAETRLLTAGGEPEAAMRLLAGADIVDAQGRSAWWADQLAIAWAEVLLAAGEPQRALAKITPEPARAVVEAGVLTACARREIGDVRGARAALASVVADLPRAPLGWQLESWLLEARLANDDGKPERARLLVDRALRAGGAEELRRPFARGSVWLRGFIDRDVLLRRTHGAFLASLSLMGSPRRRARVEPQSLTGVIVESLSEREVEVLELLAQMFSTGEIAGELYVSVNTVKTHLKGIFRKLGVNRRVDAVRRGRELGLC